MATSSGSFRMGDINSRVHAPRTSYGGSGVSGGRIARPKFKKVAPPKVYVFKMPKIAPLAPMPKFKPPPARPSTPARPTLAAALPTLYGSQGRKVPKKTMKAAKTLDKRAARKRGK